MFCTQRALFAVALALATLVGAATPSAAQNWPQRPVRFLVTLGPGSGIDIGTRLLAVLSAVLCFDASPARADRNPAMCTDPSVALRILEFRDNNDDGVPDVYRTRRD